MCFSFFSQAFVYKFSEDMALEYAPFGVKVQCVLPAFVATKMSGFRDTSLQIPSTRDFARNQMNSWGLETSSPGWWFHKIEVKLNNVKLKHNNSLTLIWHRSGSIMKGWARCSRLPWWKLRLIGFCFCGTALSSANAIGKGKVGDVQSSRVPQMLSCFFFNSL